jgi:type I restriction enzyme R subunit
MSLNMESQNFEMLRAKWSHLADLGAFAEQYLYDDPSSALVKLRNYSEQMVLWIYEVVALEMPESQNLYDLLKADVFTRLVDTAVQNKFHIIRKIGNAAAHGRPSTVEEAKYVLREAYDLGCWLYVTAGQGDVSDCPQFAFPPKISSDQTAVLAANESELQRISALLEEERKKAKKAIMAVESLKKSAQLASSELKFSEEQTRKRLIDLQLAEVGWNVDDSDAVSLELEIAEQPTKTGKGYADYVLWGDDDMPLAVIEATPRLERNKLNVTLMGWKKNTANARSSSTPTASIFSSGTTTRIRGILKGEFTASTPRIACIISSNRGKLKPTFPWLN